MIAHHGQSVQYVHDVLGVNSRLDTIQAAVLKAKLKHLDEYAEARNKAATYYDKAFASNKKLITPKRSGNSTHVFHQYTLQLVGVDRTKLREQLAEKGYWDFVFKDLKVEPSEIMFFCDSEKNVENAEKLGIKAYFYKGIETLKEGIW
jgi:dTDP-4-amino-4,6-dideoxygalactose transaminase